MIANDDDLTTDPSDSDPSEGGDSAGDGIPGTGADSAEDVGSEFVPWNEANLKQVPVPMFLHQSVVKSKHVQVAEPVKIKPLIPKYSEPAPSEAEITPILKDDQIVGVKVACDCGTVHEIMFDFSS
ncbi:MAG: hypothetical protein IID15_01170 [Candidatus Marinimicrobia bacterium]|nr:hypothetical protein [Candidatus Neomarinimicrobiota bacterium]